MARRLPPFSAIRAFEAAARHMNFKDTAEELCVTASAISHRIKTLEDYLGRRLFVRDANRLFLTEAGRAYLGELTGILDHLDRASRQASARLEAAPLRVLCTPAFAARWLVPRLDRCPLGDSLSIRVSDGAPDIDFARNEADVVLHWSDTDVPGVVVEPLMRSTRYPVASPELRRKITRPADLLDQTLLRDGVMDAWADWFAAAGVAVLENTLRGPRFPHCELIMTAAERGQGIALAYDAMVRGTLAEGRLVRLFETETLPVTIYSLAYPDGRSDRRIRLFRDWLFAEVTAEGNSIAPPRVEAAE